MNAHREVRSQQTGHEHVAPTQAPYETSADLQDATFRRGHKLVFHLGVLLRLCVVSLCTEPTLA